MRSKCFKPIQTNENKYRIISLKVEVNEINLRISLNTYNILNYNDDEI